MLRILSMAILGSLFVACASTQETKKAAKPEVQSSEAGLNAQTLSPGECGLFLWTTSAPRKFVFFSKAGTDKALVYLGGEAVQMVLTGADGDIFGQFMTDMHFDPGDGRESLNVFVEPGALLDQGQRTETARMTFTDAEGWETIVPVAGVRACQNPP